MEPSADADEIRRKREQELRLKLVLQQLLAPEAIGRLNNIRMSNPELFESLVQLFVTLHQQGKISGKVSEEQLKSLVARVLEQKRETKITFARK